MVLSIPMGMPMPAMAFVLLSEGVRYWRNKKQSICGSTVPVPKKKQEN
jgi:hypothetical protein